MKFKKFLLFDEGPKPEIGPNHTETHFPGQIVNKHVLTESHKSGVKYLTGTGLQENFDSEVFDTYLKSQPAVVRVSEEFFKFLKDNFGVD